MATLINRSRRQRAKVGGVAVWVALVAALFLWQFVQYRGIVALLAEWQFNLLGRSYPALDYLLPVTILALPALALFWRTRSRRSPERIARATLRSAAAFQKMLLTVAAVFALAALIFLFLSLGASSNQSVAQRIDLSQPVVSLPNDGPATISGSILTMQTAALHQNFLLIGKSQRYAPIVTPGSNGADFQFFVELSPSNGAVVAQDIKAISGTLRRDALPGEILRLYRYAGYHVAEPHYVLFMDPASAGWAEFHTGIQLAVIALVFGVLGLLQRRRVLRIQKTVDDGVSKTEPNPNPGLT